MRTTSQAESIVYQHIQGSPLDLACNGLLSLWKRPDSSKAEDIVINSLPVIAGPIQRMSLNVNVYVADIAYPGISNFMTQDSGRIETLAQLGMDLLEDVQGAYWNFWLETQSIFEEPDINQHYINFRLQFQFYETD